MFWKPTLALLGDVASVLTSLADGLRDYKCDSEWIDELRQRDDYRESLNRSVHLTGSLSTGLSLSLTLCHTKQQHE